MGKPDGIYDITRTKQNIETGGASSETHLPEGSIRTARTTPRERHRTGLP